mgnify:FL=1|tara:strand:+ start:10048 stop:10434 length:387 start_codon:yes stop_codon:yes gene_type:complete
MLKVYMLIMVLGFVGSVAYGGYYYYKDTQERIDILTKNNAKLETAKQQQDHTIKTMVKDRKKFEKLNRGLHNKLEIANKYRNKLIGALRKHDLTRLSQQKPDLVEKKINNGTKKLLNSLERITTPDSK